MERTLSVIRSAARRRLQRRFVERTGPALLIASGTGLAAAVVDRLAGPGFAWWHFVLWPVLVGLSVGLFLSLRRRDTPLRAAVEVDTSLRLRDRLGSALVLSESANGDPFIALVIDEAERAAPAVRVERAVPIRWGRSWAVWPLTVALAAGVALLVEPLHLFDRGSAAAPPRYAPAFVEQAKEAIQQVAASVESPDPSFAAADDDSPREILDRLARELDEGRRAPDEALSSAAGVLEEEARQAEARAAEAQAVSDRLRQALANVSSESADAPESPAGAAAKALREALKSGDLEAAAEALAELDRRLEEASPEERRRLAEEFERLAHELAEQAERAGPEQPSSQSEETLRDQGLTPEQVEALKSADRRELEERLREQGLGEEAARRLAEELDRENKARQAREQAEKDARELSETAREASRELREQAESPESRRPSQQPQPDQQPSSSPRETGRPDESRQEGQQPGEAPPSQGAPAPTGEQSPSSQQPPEPSEQQVSQSDQPNEGGSPGSSQGVKRMQEQVRGLAERERAAARDGQRADELRRQAQQLLEQASPEERERMMRWAREQLREQGGAGAGSDPGRHVLRPPQSAPGETTDVDVRRSGEQQRVAAEWHRPGGEKPDPSVSRRPLAEELAEAREAAEKAVEDQVIPPRYRNVQEFYRRAIQRAKEEEKASPRAPAPAAEDVKK